MSADGRWDRLAHVEERYRRAVERARHDATAAGELGAVRAELAALLVEHGRDKEAADLAIDR